MSVAAPQSALLGGRIRSSCSGLDSNDKQKLEELSVDLSSKQSERSKASKAKKQVGEDDLPEYEDLKDREQRLNNHESISELNDSDIDIEFDDKARP